MQLPMNSVGPTDIQSYRDCPARFEFGMRRHLPEGEKPEATDPNNAYGSAVHEALEAVGNGKSDDEAIQIAWNKYGAWLDPDDLQMLREDIETFHRRREEGVTAVLTEGELTMPLLEWGGQTIYLRGRIDRLVQVDANPAVFIHRDYKSSKWRKSAEEVHNDTQLWSYNLLIHYNFPECETLVQVYDQLRYGEERTRKSAAQRAQIKAWLQTQVVSILEDAELRPKFNQWCPYCPLLESCSVVRDLTDYATSRLVALAPSEKIGRKTVIELDPDLFDVYLEQLPTVKTARTALERFEKTVREAVMQMPAEKRHRYGFEASERSTDVWSPEALRAAHEVLGEDFYELVKLTKTSIENYGGDPGKVNAVLAMAERLPGATYLKKAR